LETLKDAIAPEIFADLEENKFNLNMNYYLNFDKSQVQQNTEEKGDQPKERDLTPPGNSFVDNEGNRYVYNPNFGIYRNAAVLTNKPNPDFQRDEYKRNPDLDDYNRYPRPQHPIERSSLSPNDGLRHSRSPEYGDPNAVAGRPRPIINHNFNCTNLYDQSQNPNAPGPNGS